MTTKDPIVRTALFFHIMNRLRGDFCWIDDDFYLILRRRKPGGVQVCPILFFLEQEAWRMRDLERIDLMDGNEIGLVEKFGPEERARYQISPRLPPGTLLLRSGPHTLAIPSAVIQALARHPRELTPKFLAIVKYSSGPEHSSIYYGSDADPDGIKIELDEENAKSPEKSYHGGMVVVPNLSQAIQTEAEIATYHVNPVNIKRGMDPRGVPFLVVVQPLVMPQSA